MVPSRARMLRVAVLTISLMAIMAILPVYPTRVVSRNTFEGAISPLAARWELHAPWRILAEGLSFRLPATDLYLAYERSPLFLFALLSLVAASVAVIEWSVSRQMGPAKRPPGECPRTVPRGPGIIRVAILATWVVAILVLLPTYPTRLTDHSSVPPGSIVARRWTLQEPWRVITGGFNSVEHNPAVQIDYRTYHAPAAAPLLLAVAVAGTAILEWAISRSSSLIQPTA